MSELSDRSAQGHTGQSPSSPGSKDGHESSRPQTPPSKETSSSDWKGSNAAESKESRTPDSTKAPTSKNVSPESNATATSRTSIERVGGSPPPVERDSLTREGRQPNTMETDPSVLANVGDQFAGPNPYPIAPGRGSFRSFPAGPSPAKHGGKVQRGSGK